MAQKKILIINPFSSSKYLADSLHHLGFNTTALYTYKITDLDTYMVPNRDDFDRQIWLESENMKDILPKLDNTYDYVLNGCEGSVELTDLLAQHFQPQFANDSNNAALRMNKYLLHEQLKRLGLNHIRQFTFDIACQNYAELANYAFEYPCFVKPTAGLGSVEARRVDSYAELEQYFRAIDVQHHYRQLIYTSNDDTRSKFIIGDYIVGDEYIVDSYSQQGVHYISSVQKYQKKNINNAPIYRTVQVVEHNDGEWQIIVDYLKQCLTASGLNNGFAHSELFMSNGKPILIEINPRISGIRGFINKLAQMSGYNTQSELLYQGLSNNFNTLKQIKSGANNWVLLFLNHFSTKPMPDLADILRKFSVVKEVAQLKPNGYVHNHLPTTLLDMAAIVLCHANDVAELNRQIDQILTQDEAGW